MPRGMGLADGNAADGFRLGHRPALDGLRGLAVLAVMTLHTRPSLTSGGCIGVDVFFVLSGFLITVLLMQEQQRTGTIRLKDFYLRRALRLAPALLAVLTACWFFTRTYDVAALPAFRGDALSVLLYGYNWRIVFAQPPRPYFLVPMWSLAVEEQFYLLWPAVLILLLRLRARRRWMVALLLLGIAGPAIFRAVRWNGPITVNRLYLCTDACADRLVIGCLVGLLASWGLLPLSPRYRWIRRGAAGTAAGVLTWHLFCTSHITSTWLYCGGFTVVGLATAVLITAALDAEPGLLMRGLSFRPLTSLGRISYGLYLWHGPLFCVLWLRLRGWSPALVVLCQFTVSITVAVLSYHLLERPFLRLKDRLGANRARKERAERHVQPSRENPALAQKQGESVSSPLPTLAGPRRFVVCSPAARLPGLSGPVLAQDGAGALQRQGCDGMAPAAPGHHPQE